MGKNLTKNARWIVVWSRYQSKDTMMFKPFEVVHNIGRWSYRYRPLSTSPNRYTIFSIDPLSTDVPTDTAIAQSIDSTKDQRLAHSTYIVDVEVFPYAKQHAEVTRLAEDHFRKQRIVT